MAGGGGSCGCGCGNGFGCCCGGGGHVGAILVQSWAMLGPDCGRVRVFFCQAKCSPSGGCMNYTSAVFEWTIKFPGKTIWSHSSWSIAIGESVVQIAVVSYQSAREGPKYMWTMDWVPVVYIGWEISWVVGCWFLLSCSERWKASESLPRRNGEERRRRSYALRLQNAEEDDRGNAIAGRKYADWVSGEGMTVGEGERVSLEPSSWEGWRTRW